MFGFESKYPAAWSRMVDAGASGMIPDLATFKGQFGSVEGPFHVPRSFPLMRVTPNYVREFATFTVMPMSKFDTAVHVPGSLVYPLGDELPNGWPVPAFRSPLGHDGKPFDDTWLPDWSIKNQTCETLEAAYEQYIGYVERELRLAENKSEGSYKKINITPIQPVIHNFKLVSWDQVNFPSGMVSQIRSGRRPHGVVPKDALGTARSSKNIFPDHESKEAYFLAMYREMMLRYCWNKVDRAIYEAILGSPMGGEYNGSGRMVPDFQVEDLPVYLNVFG